MLVAREKNKLRKVTEKSFPKRDTGNLNFPVFFIYLFKYICFLLFDFHPLREIKLSFLREPNM
jgi:hypothetical protein